MNPLSGLEKFLLLLLVVMVGFGLFGWYVSTAEKNKLLRGAEEARAKLVIEYADKERSWNSKIEAAQAQASADQKTIDTLSLQPTRVVVNRLYVAPSKTPSAPTGRAADPRYVNPAAAAGVFPEAPGRTAQEGGLFDAGPGLKADALLCESLAVRLRAWQTRYSITHQ